MRLSIKTVGSILGSAIIVLAVVAVQGQRPGPGPGPAPAGGVTPIDQSKALAGSVTPGDAPGFPVTISAAGSYQLTSNLTVPDENTTAIEVTADTVVVDLKGFVIFGPGVFGIGAGVHAPANNFTTVMNGTVRGMGGHGISLGVISRVDNVTAIGNGADGIRVESGSRVTNSTAHGNGNYGIWARSGGMVLGNTSSTNVSVGLYPFGAIGYAYNVLRDNNGGNANPQIGAGGGANLGGNLCGNAICP